MKKIQTKTKSELDAKAPKYPKKLLISPKDFSLPNPWITGIMRPKTNR